MDDGLTLLIHIMEKWIVTEWIVNEKKPTTSGYNIASVNLTANIKKKE